MQQAFVYIVILLAGLGIGVGIARYMARTPPVVTETATVIPTDDSKLMTKTMQEKGTTYAIDVKYPQFGISSIDSQITAQVESVVSQFRSDAHDEGPSSMDTSYELNITYGRTYIGPDIISGRLYITGYLGGAHPNTMIDGINYDRSTGKKLTLDDALRLTGLSLKEVAGRSAEEFSSILGAAFFPAGAAAKPENYSSFSVSSDEVTFIFQPYQVAAYAAGPQEVSFKRK